MSTLELQAIVGTTLIDREFCKELLNGKRLTLLTGFDLANEELEAVLSINANSTQEFAIGLREWLAGRNDYHNSTLLPGKEPSHEEHLNIEPFLVECLAWGLLRAYGIKVPPVSVQEMIEHPVPVFEHLSLLELNLGLYDAAYRPCLNGSRLIVVDPTKPHTIQRTSTARELYVAFCRSPRATELNWPRREQPYVHSDLFAHCLLMPNAWVQTVCAETISLEALAARFGVPVQTMTKRLDEIGYRHPRPNPKEGESLAEALFSLQEPWRDRFLGFVVNRATNKSWNKQSPTQEEVSTWLHGNPALYQDVRYMLHMWQKPARSLAH